jgi:hypothetical protein
MPTEVIRHRGDDPEHDFDRYLRCDTAGRTHMGRRERWAALAAELDFEFKVGVRAFLQSAAGRRELEERAKRGEIPSADLTFLENPLIMKMIELIFDGAIVGTHREHEFTLFPASQARTSRSGSTRYSTVTTFFKESYALEVGKILFFLQDIQLGEAQLDKLVMIKGNDELAVKRLLDSRRVRDQLISMYTESSGFTIRDFGIKHQEVAEVISRDRALHLMDQMVDLAEALPPP